jgi:hypothetical protein
MSICVVCERHPVEKHSEDPDVCIPCQKHINNICEDPMLYARAVGTLIDATHSQRSADRDQFVLAGYLAVFHPEMPGRRVTDLIIAARQSWQRQSR